VKVASPVDHGSSSTRLSKPFRTRLQDHHASGISRHMSIRASSSSRMLKLRDAEPKHANELVEDIVTKASGVFLWVTLVVRSLLSGLLIVMASRIFEEE